MPAGRPRLDQQLSHCREEGRSCQECIHQVAGSLQRICSDLTPAMARQMFPLIFTEGVCGRMSGAFVQAAFPPQECERTPRRMPGREMPVVAAAVA